MYVHIYNVSFRQLVCDTDFTIATELYRKKKYLINDLWIIRLWIVFIERNPS